MEIKEKRGTDEAVPKFQRSQRNKKNPNTKYLRIEGKQINVFQKLSGKKK